MDEKETKEASISGSASSSTGGNEKQCLPRRKVTWKDEMDEEKRKELSTLSTGKDDHDHEEVSMRLKITRIIISLMLVITGSINTLAAKWADKIYINGRYFNHPFFQATVMFVGEVCCLGAFFIVHFIQRIRWYRRHRKVTYIEDEQEPQQAYSETDEKSDLEQNGGAIFNKEDGKVAVEDGKINVGNGKVDAGNGEVGVEEGKIDAGDDEEDVGDEVSSYSDISEKPTIPRFNYILFIAPAFCDVCATSVQYVGLNLTSASAYQMLRGSVIIFTGLFSMMCLRDKLFLYKWVGMLLVVIGLVVVGVADILFTNDTAGMSRTSILAGDLLIIFSQIIVAIQMVVEQKLLADFDCPALLAVGLEGVFGFLILSILMIPMYFIHVPPMFSNSPQYRLEDALDAFQEMHDSGELIGALFLTIVSIAFFNFSGISVTKYMSATTRMVLDSVRTIIIWAVSIPLFHSDFIPLQILGFVFLILGMFVYNDVIFGPLLRKTRIGALFYPKPRIQDEGF